MAYFYAALSAVFAAATTILAKIGLKDINSNLATAIRTAVVLLMAWLVVFVTGAQKGLHGVTKSNLLFLCLSGLATGASWLFYFKAVSMGEVSRVAPIDKLSVVLTVILAFVFLHEPVGIKTVLGTVLIAAGVLLML